MRFCQFKLTTCVGQQIYFIYFYYYYSRGDIDLQYVKQKQMKTSSNGSVSAPNLPKNTKKLKPQYLNEKFDQLYQEVYMQIIQSAKLKAKKLKTQQQIILQKALEQKKHCTFKPQIINNPQLASSVHDPSPFLERGQHWQERKQKKVQQLAKVYDSKQKLQCSFRPQVSKNSYNLLHNPKESRLFRNESYASNAQMKKTYRQIHMKKEEIRELHKTNSVFQFNLMTERNRLSPTKKPQIEDKKIQQTALSKQQTQIIKQSHQSQNLISTCKSRVSDTANPEQTKNNKIAELISLEHKIAQSTLNEQIQENEHQQYQISPNNQQIRTKEQDEQSDQQIERLSKDASQTQSAQNIQNIVDPSAEQNQQNELNLQVEQAQNTESSPQDDETPSLKGDQNQQDDDQCI